MGAYLTVMWVLLVLVNASRSSPLVSHDTQCRLGEWVVWLGYPLMVLPYALRAYRMHRLYSVRSSEKLAGEARRWRKLVTTESHLLKIFGGVMFLFACVMVARVTMRWEVNMVGYGCGSDVTAGWLSLHAAEALMLCGVLYSLRESRDDFGVMAELAAVAGVWVVAAAAQFSAEAIHSGSAINGWFGGGSRDHAGGGLGQLGYLRMSVLVVAARNSLLFAVSVMAPLCRTYCEPFVPLWSTCDSMRSLESLLKDIVCISYFRAYLTEQDKAESILCWVEIELFSDVAAEDGDDAAAEHARRIHDKYMTRGAELEVRVSDGARSRVLKAIEAGEAGPFLFREVQLELFQLMHEDFALFLASDTCRVCMQELEREEHLRSVLQHSEMI